MSFPTPSRSLRYTAETDASSPDDELNPEEAQNLDVDVPATLSNVTLEQLSSDELEIAILPEAMSVTSLLVQCCSSLIV